MTTDSVPTAADAPRPAPHPLSTKVATDAELLILAEENLDYPRYHGDLAPPLSSIAYSLLILARDIVRDRARES